MAKNLFEGMVSNGSPLPTPPITLESVAETLKRFDALHPLPPDEGFKTAIYGFSIYHLLYERPNPFHFIRIEGI